MDETEVLGYLFLACKELNFDEKTVRKLTDSMTLNMSMMTGEEAMEKGFAYFVELIHDGTPSKEEPKIIDPELLKVEFETIWSLYPRRLGKLKAYKAYIQARKKGASYKKIEAGIKDYITFIDQNKMDINFVKHGSSWFQNQCWDDDYSQ